MQPDDRRTPQLPASTCTSYTDHRRAAVVEKQYRRKEVAMERSRRREVKPEVLRAPRQIESALCRRRYWPSLGNSCHIPSRHFRFPSFRVVLYASTYRTACSITPRRCGLSAFALLPLTRTFRRAESNRINMTNWAIAGWRNLACVRLPGGHRIDVDRSVYYKTRTDVLFFYVNN